MAQNILANFQNLGEESGTLVDYFIECTQIRLLGCGFVETSAARVSNFMQPYFLAVFYQKGTVEIQHENETTLLEPGSFFLFRPNEISSGRKLGSTPIGFSYLLFDITPFVARYNFGLLAPISTDAVFRRPQYRLIGELLERLAADSADRRGRSAMLRQLVKMLLGQLLYDQSRQNNDYALLKKGRNSKIINHAFRYTAEHLSSPIVIGEILQDGKTSKTSLERAFRDVLGTTPQRALLRFKIERSTEMLLRNYALKDIAKGLGFSSVFHYSNMFKRITGMRPTEYRAEIADSRLLAGDDIPRPL